jgi:hypothetical protein
MELMPIHLLMESNTPLAAYTDKALADADCWNCNDAQRYIDIEQLDYWVKTVDLIATEQESRETFYA